MHFPLAHPLARAYPRATRSPRTSTARLRTWSCATSRIPTASFWRSARPTVRHSSMCPSNCSHAIVCLVSLRLVAFDRRLKREACGAHFSHELRSLSRLRLPRSPRFRPPTSIWPTRTRCASPWRWTRSASAPLAWSVLASTRARVVLYSRERAHTWVLLLLRTRLACFDNCTCAGQCLPMEISFLTSIYRSRNPSSHLHGKEFSGAEPSQPSEATFSLRGCLRALVYLLDPSSGEAHLQIAIIALR